MTAPTISHPTPGQSIPQGDPCPRCGVLRQHWVYNPFVRDSKEHAGWVLWRSQLCDCPNPEEERFTRLRAHTLPPTPAHDQAWLDRELNREATRHLTFASFSRRSAPALAPALAFCQHYAAQQRPHQNRMPPGLFLAGPASPEREHLLAALANAARANGCPTALVSHCQIIERLTLPERAQEWEQERQRVCTRILRNVPLLAIAGLLSVPITPVELKNLFSLIDHRARAGLTTHFSAHAPPKAIRDQAARSGAPPGLQTFTLTLEQCTLQAIACPGGKP